MSGRGGDPRSQDGWNSPDNPALGGSGSYDGYSNNSNSSELKGIGLKGASDLVKDAERNPHKYGELNNLKNKIAVANGYGSYMQYTRSLSIPGEKPTTGTDLSDAQVDKLMEVVRETPLTKPDGFTPSGIERGIEDNSSTIKGVLKGAAFGIPGMLAGLGAGIIQDKDFGETPESLKGFKKTIDDGIAYVNAPFEAIDQAIENKVGPVPGKAMDIASWAVAGLTVGGPVGALAAGVIGWLAQEPEKSYSVYTVPETESEKIGSKTGLDIG